MIVPCLPGEPRYPHRCLLVPVTVFPDRMERYFTTELFAE
jgi:hypothetical protein